MARPKFQGGTNEDEDWSDEDLGRELLWALGSYGQYNEQSASSQVGQRCLSEEPQLRVVGVACADIGRLRSRSRSEQKSKKSRSREHVFRRDLSPPKLPAPRSFSLRADEDQQVNPIATLPHGWIANPELHVEDAVSCAPVIHIKNIDGARGRIIAARMLGWFMQHQRLYQAFQSTGTDLDGCPQRSKIDEVGCDLGEIAEHTLAYLRDVPGLVAKMPLLLRRPEGPSTTRIQVFGPGRGVGMQRHKDNTAGGALVVIFSLGLTCHSNIWPDCKQAMPVTHALESGDVMIFDPAMIPHEIENVKKHTSPFKDPLLKGHRVSIVIWQAPPSEVDGSRCFTIGKHRGRSFLDVYNGDHGYCGWSLKQDRPTGDINLFSMFLRSMPRYRKVA